MASGARRFTLHFYKGCVSPKTGQARWLHIPFCSDGAHGGARCWSWGSAEPPTIFAFWGAEFSGRGGAKMPCGGGTSCFTLQHSTPPSMERKAACVVCPPCAVSVCVGCARHGGAASPRGADRQPRRPPARRGALPAPDAIPGPGSRWPAVREGARPPVNA